MEAPGETPNAVSGTTLPQSGEIVLAKFEALTSHGNESGLQAPEQMEEQVLGYLEVQPSEVQLVQDSSTFYLQPQEIEIDGEHLILAQGEEAGEIIVVVSTDQEHSTDQAVAELAQGAVVNATMMHAESGEKTRMFVVNQSTGQFSDRKVASSPSIKTEIEQFSKSLPVEQVTANTQNDSSKKNSSIENILATEASSTLSHSKEADVETPRSTSLQVERDRKLMQLACIAHEMEIERSHIMSQTRTTAVSEVAPRKIYSSERKGGASNSNVCAVQDNMLDKSRSSSSDISVQHESLTKGETPTNEVLDLKCTLSDKLESAKSDLPDPNQTLSDISESPSVKLFYPSHNNLSDKQESSVKEVPHLTQTEGEKPEAPTSEMPDHNLTMSENPELSASDVPSKTGNEDSESSRNDVLDSNEVLDPSQTPNEQSKLPINEAIDCSHLLSDKLESSVSEVLAPNQSVESVERNRRSMEAAETIAALQHSNRSLHDEKHESVPSHSNASSLVENPSSLMTETDVSTPTDTHTFSCKAKNMKKIEAENAGKEYESKLKPEVMTLSSSSDTATAEEASITEVRENQIEYTVILGSSGDKHISEPSKHVKESCAKEESNVNELCFMEDSVLEEKMVNAKLGETQLTGFPEIDKKVVLCEERESEMDKNGVELLSNDEILERSPSKVTSLNLAHPSINTSADSSAQIHDIYNVIEEQSSKNKVSEDINNDLKNDFAEMCKKVDSNTSLLIRENLSPSNVGSAEDVNEATNTVNNLSCAEVSSFELNAKSINTSLQHKLSQHTIKSSSSLTASGENVLDTSADQVVPQIDLASGSVGKNPEVGSIDQSTSGLWLMNRQEECTSFSDVQKVAHLEDLPNKEHQAKMTDFTCLSSDITYMQKDENYQYYDVSNKVSTTEFQSFDKVCSTNLPEIKAVTEESKRVIQTTECVQKSSFMQSTPKPLRPKQPVVIHLRSSITKPPVDDLNKSASANRLLPCGAKESRKEEEILSSPASSEIEENSVKLQLRNINDSDVSTVHNNANITKDSSILEADSFVEVQETESSDPRSIGKKTSHMFTEICSDQVETGKNEVKNSVEDRTECLTPKIKKQFQLLISAEKSDAEVSLSSIKSKIHQKLQIDSDDNENLKDMDILCEEQPVPMTGSEENFQDQSPPRDTQTPECKSVIPPENEESSESTLRTRGTKRKSSLSSTDKIAKLSTVENKESLGTEQHIKVELPKKAGKRKSDSDFEKLAKQLRSSLNKQTGSKDQIFKSRRSAPLQKNWCLRSSASIKEVKDLEGKDLAGATADQPVSVAKTDLTEIPTEKSRDNSTEAESIHPVSETTRPELLSSSLLESVAEDSDHSGISEDLLSQPPVLITRNKFLNSNSLSSKNKRQYIKKHVKSKSAVQLSVQKVQSPRKYSPRKQKSVVPSADTSQKKHLRTKSEPTATTDLAKEEETVITPVKVCDFRIRCQTPTTPPDKVVSYSCVGCCFRTSRVQNLIHHYREKCSYTGPDAFHWDVDQIEGAKREDSQKNLKANGSPPTKHIIDTGKNVFESTTLMPVKKIYIQSADDVEETVDSDSNSDDLPPAFDTPSKKKFGFAEDDVVWVEWKTLHWPALVRKIYIKDKKASIMFIDSPSSKKGIRVPIKKISTFNNAERNKKYLSEGRAASAHSDSLVKAVQKAEDFLRKRCLGINISAAQFFGNLDDFTECMSDRGSSTGTPSEPGDISRDHHLTDVSSSQTLCPVLRTNEESSKQFEDPEDKCEATDSESVARRKEKRKLQNAKLLQCIKDGKVETHLLGVYRNTIASERHRLFHSNVASERNQLKHVSWFGPIDDEEQQEEIYDYCLQLFKSACQYKETFDLVAYMFEVWVPEAIVRAIARVRRLNMNQAEEIFAKGVNWSKAEKEEARKEFTSFPLTEEDRREHKERMADSLRIAGVEENIIESLDL